MNIILVIDKPGQECTADLGCELRWYRGSLVFRPLGRETFLLSKEIVMIRLLLIIWILSLALGSCGELPDEEHADTITSEPTVTESIVPTGTPSPSDTPVVPTKTSKAAPTVTATLEPLQTATQPETDSRTLPELTTNQPITISHISMVDNLNGWAIGHQNSSGDRILFTMDGGESWEERTPPIPVSSDLSNGFQVWGYFYDEQSAWTIFLPKNQPPPIEAPVIWWTTDGGYLWQSSEPLPLTGEESFFIPENFSFVDPLQGWLLVHIDAGMSHDYSNLYSTSDGGISWARLIDPYAEGLQSLYNTGLEFSNPVFGWVTKDNLGVLPGTFLEQSNDGGHTWEDNFLPSPPEFDWFNEISQCETSNPLFFEGTKGIVLVNCRTYEEQDFTYTYQSPDQGVSWQSVRLPTPVQSLIFIDNQIGWALGRNIYKSTDGGLSWVKIKTVNWDGQFSFVDENSGWAVATSDDDIALVFTQDGGKNWQLIKPILK